jgi:hypothetical protein
VGGPPQDSGEAAGRYAELLGGKLEECSGV